MGSTAAGALNNPDTWSDWLIVEETAPVDSNGSVLLRRITPKSVFVAPSFSDCSEGYRKDSLGRCVKLVKVNQQAQWNFLLEKLNSMYASPQSAKTETKEESEPFRISIPIGTVGNKTNTETQQSSTSFPITASFGGSSSEPHSIHDSVATTVKVDRETTTKLDETTTMKLSETVMMKDDPNSTLLFNNTNKTVLSLNQRDSETETHPPRNDQGVREASKVENKKFLIVVSGDESVKTTVAPVSPLNEETTGLPMTTSLSKDEELTSTGTEDYFSESVSTTDSTVMTTTGETVTNPSRFDSDLTTTTIPIRTSDYDNYDDSSGSDKSDEPVITEQQSLKVKLPLNVRSKCDQSVQVSQLKNGQIVGDSSTINCETVQDDEQPTKTLLTSPSNQPVLEPSSQIRFPSESNLPVRKTTNYIKFPETPVSHYNSKLWDSSHSRQPYWWPSSWEYSQHPGIRGWPPMDGSHQSPQSQQPSSGLSSFHKQYHQYNPYPTYHQQTHSWSSPTATWHRRIFQRE